MEGFLQASTIHWAHLLHLMCYGDRENSFLPIVSSSTATALSIYRQDVSNTVAFTGPGIILKNRVVAKVLREFEEAKSYLTSVLLESRKNVTWRLPPIWIVMNIQKGQQFSVEKLTEKVQVSTGPYKSSCCTPPNTAFDWARISPGKGWMNGSTLNKVFLSLSLTRSESGLGLTKSWNILGLLLAHQRTKWNSRPESHYSSCSWNQTY